MDSLELRIERPDPDQVAILLPERVHRPHCWMVSDASLDHIRPAFAPFRADGHSDRLDLPAAFEPGLTYRIRVAGLMKLTGVGTGEEEFDDSRSCYMILSVGEISFNSVDTEQSVLDDFEVDLRIEQKTYREVDLDILPTGSNSRVPDFWILQINDADSYRISGSEKRFRIPGHFDAGLNYKLSLRGLLEVSGEDQVVPEAYVIPWQKTVQFRSVLTIDDLRRLLSMAITMATDHGLSTATPSKRCVWLYRNKPPEYFQQIFDEDNGQMTVRLKDHSGDPGSPINGHLSGLFFMASVDRMSDSGRPIPVSPFGSSRISIDARVMLNQSINLYFTDFYCMKSDSYHYVTLVIARPGSDADEFCSKRLVKLDIDDQGGNPFLFLDQTDQLRVSARDHLLVEVFFTEHIDITPHKHIMEHNIRTVAGGTCTPGGIRKNPYCTECNLYPRNR